MELLNLMDLKLHDKVLLDNNNYLFQIVEETREYELMMIGADYGEVVRKGEELEDAYSNRTYLEAGETPSVKSLKSV